VALDAFEGVDDGLINLAYLERHLPADVPFRGHALRWTRCSGGSAASLRTCS
jgi:hypothetical protein